MWEAKRREVDEQGDRITFVIDFTETDTGEQFTGKYTVPYLTDAVMEQHARSQVVQLNMVTASQGKLTYAEGDTIAYQDQPVAPDTEMQAFVKARAEASGRLDQVRLGLLAADDAVVREAQERLRALYDPHKHDGLFTGI